MGLSGLLGSALTATTNPNPNTLGTVTPYPTPYVNRKTVSTAWTSQGAKALFPAEALNGSGEVKIPLQFVPSTGGATYTGTIWIYSKLSNTWVKPHDTPSINFTGEELTYIENPMDNPIFIQLSSISAGTLTIYFDTGLAMAM